MRLRCSPWVQPGTSERDWAAVAALQGTGGRRWQVRGAKLFIDGTIDNGTAWLAEPDTLGESTSPFWPDPAAYSRAIAWFDAHDVPTATHAIGDQGVRHVLQRTRRSQRSRAAPDRARRDDPGRPGRGVRDAAGHGQHAAHPLHRVHRAPTAATTGRPGSVRCGQPWLADPRPARRRRPGRARVRLADRGLRPARHPRRSAAAPEGRCPRPGSDPARPGDHRPDGARGLHDPCGLVGRRRGRGRHHRGRQAGRPDRVRRGPAASRRRTSSSTLRSCSPSWRVRSPTRLPSCRRGARQAARDSGRPAGVPLGQVRRAALGRDDRLSSPSCRCTSKSVASGSVCSMVVIQ